MNVSTYHHWKLNHISGAVAALGVFLIYASLLEHSAMQSISVLFPTGVMILLAGLGIFALGLSVYLRHWPHRM